MPAPEVPQLLVHWERTVGELLDRTAHFPKAVRFTFAQRIDGLAQVDVVVAEENRLGPYRAERAAAGEYERHAGRAEGVAHPVQELVEGVDLFRR